MTTSCLGHELEPAQSTLIAREVRVDDRRLQEIRLYRNRKGTYFEHPCIHEDETPGAQLGWLRPAPLTDQNPSRWLAAHPNATVYVGF
jgi:hypothetical protein